MSNQLKPVAADEPVAPGVHHGTEGVDVTSDSLMFEFNDESGLNQTLKNSGRTIWWAAGSILLAVAWAGMAEIEQVTRGLGSVIASQKTQSIQAADGGVIEELLVHEGDTVVANQVLARLDQGKAGAAVAEVQSKRDSLTATIVRLRAEVLNTPLIFPVQLQKQNELLETQRRMYAKRTRAFNEELESLNRTLSLALDELELNRRLLKAGDVGKTEVIRLDRQANEIQSQITNRRNKYFQDTQAELAKAEEDLAAVEQTLNQRKTSLEYTVLNAPVAGVIKNVRFTTRGAVLRPGDELLTIVPNDDSLIVEAKIRPSDIAFIRKGMPANVKIDSYDYTIYGALRGEVIYISADALNEENRPASGEAQTYYRVHVETKDKAFRNRPDEPLDLLPGMTASVEVKTGRNTVLKYMLKPVLKTLNESLGER